MLHTAIKDNANSLEEIFFLLFSLLYDLPLLLTIKFKKKQKDCLVHMHLITDDGSYDQKAFYKAKKQNYSSFFVACVDFFLF